MRIGARRVLSSGTAFIPDGECATFDCVITPDDVFTVVFEPVDETPQAEIKEDKSSPPPRIEFKPDSPDFHLYFFNFVKQSGYTITNFAMGVSDNQEPIVLVGAVYKMVGLSRIDYQIMLLDANND